MKVILFALGFFISNACFAQEKLFDTHLHYGGEDVELFSPEQVMAIFDQNKIEYALISSTPNDGTLDLYRHAPQRIIPFLGVYRTLAEKRDWMWDESVITRLEQPLSLGVYRGIGEFHIFAKDRKSPVLRKIVEIARDRGLMLQIHGDAVILDEVFSIAPNIKVLWAHMGTQPEPEFLRSVLNKHAENLYIDTTVRDVQLLGEAGVLSDEWKQLFIDYQDNFTIGVDTFSVNRWQTFSQVTEMIQAWLSQLPKPVAKKIAYDNAYQLLIENQP